MPEFIDTFSATERVFFLAAFTGGLTFIVMTILMFVGGGVDEAEGISGDADASFKALSLNGISAFFMMFGLVGLAALREFDSNSAMAAIVGAIAGLAAVATLKKLFSLFQGLEESGNVKNDAAIGCIGTVYINLPEQGTGQVELTIQGRLRVMDAISTDSVAIETGQRVEVIGIESGNTLRVKRASNE